MPTTTRSTRGSKANQQTQVVEGFLQQACPGEVPALLDDLQKLLPPKTLTPEFIHKMASLYASTHGQIVQSTASPGKKVLLHQLGEQGEEGGGGGYLDPATGEIVTVDHLTGNIVKTSKAPAEVMDASLEAKRLALAEAVTEHVAANYNRESSASAVYAYKSTLYVVIYSELVDLRNFKSGSWLSVWEIQDKEGQQTISGTIKTRSHYFEEGNAQLHTTKVLPERSLPLQEQEQEGSTSTGAGTIVDAIMKAENDVQLGLENMFYDDIEEGLRKLRRKLPVSKQRMDWGQVAMGKNKINKTIAK